MPPCRDDTKFAQTQTSARALNPSPYMVCVPDERRGTPLSSDQRPDPSRNVGREQRCASQQIWRSITAMGQRRSSHVVRICLLIPQQRRKGGHSLTSHLCQKATSQIHYSTISSAIDRMYGGIVRLSDAAALRLIASPNFVGSWIGNSPAFAPLRMRSTYTAACRNVSAKSGP